MLLTKKLRSSAGSCQFCTRLEGREQVAPYKYVWVATQVSDVGCTPARFCKKCLKQMLKLARRALRDEV